MANLVYISGTVLVIGTMVLGGVLLFVGLLALGLSSFIVVAYYSVFVFGVDVVNSIQDRLASLSPASAFVSREKIGDKEEHEE